MTQKPPRGARVGVGTSALLGLASSQLPSSHQHPSRARFCLSYKPVSLQLYRLDHTNRDKYDPILSCEDLYSLFLPICSLNAVDRFRFCLPTFFFLIPNNICLLFLLVTSLCTVIFAIREHGKCLH